MLSTRLLQKLRGLLARKKAPQTNGVGVDEEGDGADDVAATPPVMLGKRRRKASDGVTRYVPAANNDGLADTLTKDILRACFLGQRYFKSPHCEYRVRADRLSHGEVKPYEHVRSGICGENEYQMHTVCAMRLACRHFHAAFHIDLVRARFLTFYAWPIPSRSLFALGLNYRVAAGYPVKCWDVAHIAEFSVDVEERLHLAIGLYARKRSTPTDHYEEEGVGAFMLRTIEQCIMLHRFMAASLLMSFKPSLWTSPPTGDNQQWVVSLLGATFPMPMRLYSCIMMPTMWHANRTEAELVLDTLYRAVGMPFAAWSRATRQAMNKDAEESILQSGRLCMMQWLWMLNGVPTARIVCPPGAVQYACACYPGAVCRCMDFFAAYELLMVCQRGNLAAVTWYWDTFIVGRGADDTNIPIDYNTYIGRLRSERGARNVGWNLLINNQDVLEFMQANFPPERGPRGNAMNIVPTLHRPPVGIVNCCGENR